MKKRYRQLTQEERYQIKAALTQELTLAVIARQLGRAPSTISREVKSAGGKDRYQPSSAHREMQQRRSQANKANKRTSWMIATVNSLLAMGLSPEQIAHRLGFEKSKERVSHEWIYQYIFRDKQAGGDLWMCLRQHEKRYRKRYGSHARRGIIKNRVSISERPEIVDKRKRKGDWEGDTVHGKNANLVTLVDRKSGFTAARKVSRRTRRAVTKAINQMLKNLPAHTLTLDNGPEFAGHEVIARKSGIDVYFAEPYSSWQRGTNENTNGLIRQYLPKGSDFSHLTKAEVEAIVRRINMRPRKRLGWRSPAEVFFGVSVALIT